LGVSLEDPGMRLPSIVAAAIAAALLSFALLSTLASAGRGDSPSPAEGPRVIPSLPFRIDRPGSYVLASNLAGREGAPGIVVASSDVTLDLGGFALLGGSGTTHGIVTLGALENVTVRNGTVRGFGGTGLDAASAYGVRLRDVRSAGNGGDGLVAGDAGSVRDCLALGNGGTGILLLHAGEVVASIATGNGGEGIAAGPYSMVRENEVTGNCADGILAGEKTVILENHGTLNGRETFERPCRGAGVGFEDLSVILERNFTTDNDASLERRHAHRR